MSRFAVLLSEQCENFIYYHFQCYVMRLFALININH